MNSNIPIDDLELSVRTLNALKKCGVTTLGQAEKAVNDGRLSKQPGIGRRAIREVLEIIYNVETLMPKAQPVEAKVHPLVELLVARAKSHPDEFTEERDTLGGAERWWRAVDVISRNGTDADKALMASTVGRLAMDKAHEWALDELLNGDERREMQRREEEEREKRFAAQQAAMSQQTQQAQLYGQAAQNSYRNALSNSSGAQISGFTHQVAAVDSMSLGGETLTPTMLKQIKKVLGVK